MQNALNRLLAHKQVLEARAAELRDSRQKSRILGALSAINFAINILRDEANIDGNKEVA